jgi:very-short-patch-repair endonuclease
MNNKYKTPGYIIDLARDLRNSMTGAEKVLWDVLKKRQICGLKFRNQHPINRYILDFFCHEKMLAIEVDGDVHSERKTYDHYRDEFLKSAGIKTLRFSNSDVLSDLNGVLQRIRFEAERIV